MVFEYISNELPFGNIWFVVVVCVCLSFYPSVLCFSIWCMLCLGVSVVARVSGLSILNSLFLACIWLYSIINWNATHLGESIKCKERFFRFLTTDRQNHCILVNLRFFLKVHFLQVSAVNNVNIPWLLTVYFITYN